ncbi:hypothetical protein B0H14DRAFT_3169239 [Mycena olivaceomarginata]|nr:hypothetical protein B0H14DRAFT_3169239 [Mycena olivaceomarginata]
MLSIKALTSLAIVASTALTNVHAQCPQFVVVLVLSLTNLYVVGMRDISVHSTPLQGILSGLSGVLKAISLGGVGIFTLDKTGNTTNYLSVQTFSNTCNDGGPVFIQISSPKDPNVPYVSLVAGVTDCSTAAFSGPSPLGCYCGRGRISPRSVHHPPEPPGRRFRAAITTSRRSAANA